MTFDSLKDITRNILPSLAILVVGLMAAFMINEAYLNTISDSASGGSQYSTIAPAAGTEEKLDNAMMSTIDFETYNPFSSDLPPQPQANASSATE